jgi:hypothetical protein
MKTMYYTKRNSGKVIAVILILLFFGINFIKSSSEGGPQEKHFAKIREEKVQAQKFNNNLGKQHDVQKLKFAYTGNWEKNDLSKNPQDGKYAFTTPENTRGQIQATAAKKAADAKKKNKLAKKAKAAAKIAKRSDKNRFNLEDHGIDDSSTVRRIVYFAQTPPQQRTPSDEEKEKKLTAEEWLKQILSNNSVSEFVSKYREGKDVSQSLFYSVVESLLTNDQDSVKKLGYEALASTPSVLSLTKYAQHKDDEMSEELKTYVKSTLLVYNQPSQLRVLNTALNSTDNKVKILAANIIQSIASAVLLAQTSTGENTVYTPAQIEVLKTMLAQSLTVITNALKTDLESAVLVSFTATQSVLEQILS